jgi:hypothetical protein
MTRMVPRIVIPAELTDPAKVNKLIATSALDLMPEGAESIVVAVGYDGQGSDLVRVSADGLIEAVD